MSTPPRSGRRPRTDYAFVGADRIVSRPSVDDPQINLGVQRARLSPATGVRGDVRSIAWLAPRLGVRYLSVLHRFRSGCTRTCGRCALHRLALAPCHVDLRALDACHRAPAGMKICSSRRITRISANSTPPLRESWRRVVTASTSRSRRTGDRRRRHAVEALARECPGITFGWCRSELGIRGVPWRGGSAGVRLSAYLDPFYDAAPLAPVARPRSDAAAVIALGRPAAGIRRPAWRRLFGRWLNALVRRCRRRPPCGLHPRPAARRRWIITPLSELGSQQIDYLRRPGAGHPHGDASGAGTTCRAKRLHAR
jgi:hypothetical protein